MLWAFRPRLEKGTYSVCPPDAGLASWITNALPFAGSRAKNQTSPFGLR